MAPRRWSFETYKAEQRAGNNLCARVKALVSTRTQALARAQAPARPTLIVWGAGTFGPTSRGHASAPNKKMQKLLSRCFPVVLSCERNTSKISSCCHVPTRSTSAHPDQDPGRHPRSDVRVCNGCHTLLSRDGMAAKNILDIFMHQQQHTEYSCPAWCN